MSNFYFLPLGGAGEIGMNLNLYHFDGRWLMVDCGISFTDTHGLEVIMPDPTFIEDLKDKLDGIVLTHAHEDHIGALPYLWTRFQCPMYATPFTASLIRHKLKDIGVMNPPLHEVLLSSSISVGPFDVRFITLTHSIPEPNALAIRTQKGTVIHTGDWKIDPQPLIGGLTEDQTLREEGDKGVLAMICDSTNVFQEGTSGSEAHVQESLMDLIGQYPGRRVIVACFASNVARLSACYEGAKAHGRHISLVGRSLWRVDGAARGCGYLTSYPTALEDREAAALDRGHILYVCTGSQGEPRSALVRLSRGQNPHLSLEEGDVVIFSSRMIPGNEKSIYALQNDLTRKGITVITHDDSFVHVSGHPARDELRQMYEWVRPKIAIPVHGEDRHLAEHARLAEECGVPYTIVPKNGTLIELDADNPQIIDEVYTGVLALDGTRLIPYYGDIMRDRFRLMAAGHIQISFVLNSAGKIKAEPQITLIGIADDETYDQYIEDIHGALEDVWQSFDRDTLEKDEKIKEGVRTAVRRLMNQSFGKKPLTTVHISRVK